MDWLVDSSEMNNPKKFSNSLGFFAHDCGQSRRLELVPIKNPFSNIVAVVEKSLETWTGFLTLVLHGTLQVRSFLFHRQWHLRSRGDPSERRLLVTTTATTKTDEIESTGNLETRDTFSSRSAGSMSM